MRVIAFVPITPLLGAVLICWIFSVCVHEFSHAIVAYWGGDTSVRQRGYLSFNPFYYIHPVTSILLPCVFLLMGGVPLPGGAVLINRSSLRSRGWESLVSAAGPASNFVLFILIAIVIHPDMGLVDSSNPNPSNWARLLGIMAVLQVFAVLLNLIPVPPFDGFGIIEAFFDDETRRRLSHPQMQWIGLVLVFVVLFRSDRAIQAFYGLIDGVLVRFGLPWDLTWGNFNLVITGSS